jgi:hypothetical protein
MSNNANRSFERIMRNDLARLARLALSNFDDFFAIHPDHPYAGRLRLICLMQTAAKHYVSPDRCAAPNQTWGGVNDFDVCGFFESVPGRPLYARRISRMDFGPSKFGHNPDDGDCYTGRRVDVMWRSIDMPLSPIESVQALLREERTVSARWWGAKAAVVLWPSMDLGE